MENTSAEPQYHLMISSNDIITQPFFSVKNQSVCAPLYREGGWKESGAVQIAENERL